MKGMLKMCRDKIKIFIVFLQIIVAGAMATAGDYSISYTDYFNPLGKTLKWDVKLKKTPESDKRIRVIYKVNDTRDNSDLLSYEHKIAVNGDHFSIYCSFTNMDNENEDTGLIVNTEGSSSGAASADCIRNMRGSNAVLIFGSMKREARFSESITLFKTELLKSTYFQSEPNLFQYRCLSGDMTHAVCNLWISCSVEIKLIQAE